MSPRCRSRARAPRGRRRPGGALTSCRRRRVCSRSRLVRRRSRACSRARFEQVETARPFDGGLRVLELGHDRGELGRAPPHATSQRRSEPGARRCARRPPPSRPRYRLRLRARPGRASATAPSARERHRVIRLGSPLVRTSLPGLSRVGVVLERPESARSLAAKRPDLAAVVLIGDRSVLWSNSSSLSAASAVARSSCRRRRRSPSSRSSRVSDSGSGSLRNGRATATTQATARSAASSRAVVNASRGC